tara:strand:- start:387 stop:503 length:117 start_codon:yes stop_codon:yes gene_type:complete
LKHFLGFDKAKEFFDRGLKTKTFHQLNELQREYLGGQK